MSDLLVPKIILPTDMSANISMKEVAKILTATEGATSAEKRDEIFSIFMGVQKIGQGMKDFFVKETANVATIFDTCVEATGLVDVLALQHQKTRWLFAVQTARIPKRVYQTTTPEMATRLAGEAMGLVLARKYNFPLHFMYADSRVYRGPSNTGDKNVNIGYIFGYKEQSTPYS